MESNVEKELQEYKKFKETFCFEQKEIVQFEYQLNCLKAFVQMKGKI